MTDIVNALIVTLKENMREDDVQQLIEAIRLYGNVIDVEPNVPNNVDAFVERTRLRQGLMQHIFFDKSSPLAQS